MFELRVACLIGKPTMHVATSGLFLLRAVKPTALLPVDAAGFADFTFAE